MPARELLVPGAAFRVHFPAALSCLQWGGEPGAGRQGRREDKGPLMEKTQVDLKYHPLLSALKKSGPWRAAGLQLFALLIFTRLSESTLMVIIVLLLIFV